MNYYIVTMPPLPHIHSSVYATRPIKIMDNIEQWEFYYVFMFLYYIYIRYTYMHDWNKMKFMCAKGSKNDNLWQYGNWNSGGYSLPLAKGVKSPQENNVVLHTVPHCSMRCMPAVEEEDARVWCIFARVSYTCVRPQAKVWGKGRQAKMKLLKFNAGHLSR